MASCAGATCRAELAAGCPRALLHAGHLRQVGTPFSEEYLQSCLLANVHIVRQLVRLFEARFDPEAESGGEDVAQALVHQIRGALTR